MTNNLKKNFICNIVGTTLNAFNSLFFMIIVTRLNGTDIAGIFTFAFSTATLFNVIGVYSGRVYQVTDKSHITDKDFIVNKIITCSIMLIVSIIFVLINKYDIYKALAILILCLLKCLEAFTEVIYAIIQRDDELYKVGISLSIKSILGLMCFLIVDLIFKNILIAELALLISYIVVMIFYDYKQLNKSSYIKNKANKENVIEILKKGMLPFLITFLCLYIVNASKYAIDITLTNTDQTIFGIIIMPATVVLMLSQFLLHPFLNRISTWYTQSNKKEIKSIISKFIIIIFAFGIFSTLLAWLIGIPVLEFIYNVNLTEYRVNLTIIMIGASMYGIVSILSNILITMRHNLSQIPILVVISILTFICSYVLTKKYMLFGATLSYLITMLLLFVAFLILILFFINKIGNENKKVNT